MDNLSRLIRQRIEQINAKLSETEKDTLLGGIQKLPECSKNQFRSFEILKILGMLGGEEGLEGWSLRLFGSWGCTYGN